MKKSAAILIPDGFEEIETIAVLDILRRGGIDTIIVGYKNINTIGAHKLSIQAECIFADIISQTYDCIILPGGPGCYTLRDDRLLHTFLNKHFSEKKLVCAICAAPLILHDAGILLHKKYTAHPCTYNELTEAISSKSVVVDQNLITGSGPGVSLNFGFTVLQYLTDKQTTQQLKTAMLFCENV